MRRSAFIAACFLALIAHAETAQSQTAGGTTVVLVPGASGASPNDFLIRNQSAFAAYGLTTVVAVSPDEVFAKASALKAQGQRVVLVGMSAGAPRVARALALGAPAAKAVFVSGALVPGLSERSVIQNLGSPARLPATLVVHNRGDECRLTPPDAVPQFIRWSAGRATVQWIEGGGGPGQPCQARSAHGFFGVDGQAVGAIAAFAVAR